MGDPARLVTFSLLVMAAIFFIFSSQLFIMVTSNPGVLPNCAQKGRFFITIAEIFAV